MKNRASRVGGGELDRARTARSPSAIARKLTVAVWYLLMGRWTPLEEIDERLSRKIGTIMTQVGAKGLQELDKTRQALREQVHQSLKAGRVYVLDPNLKFVTKPAGQTCANPSVVPSPATS